MIELAFSILASDFAHLADEVAGTMTLHATARSHQSPQITLSKDDLA